jgi:drug/metabolite transporter (DMT)-like permease
MANLSKNTRGAILITLGALCFVSNDVILKSFANELPWQQPVLLRSIIGTFFLLLLALTVEGRKSTKELLVLFQDKYCALRIFCEALATVLWVSSLMKITLASAISINQSLPVFLMLGGVFFFKEKISWRRKLAAIISFVGVLLIIQPWSTNYTIWVLISLLSALAMATRDLATKAIPEHFPTFYITMLSMAGITIVILPFALLGQWMTMDGVAWLKTVSAAILISFAFLFTIIGTRLGEMSFLAIFRYTSLVWGMLFSLAFFNERLDFNTTLGATLILFAGIYMVFREQKLTDNL